MIVKYGHGANISGNAYIVKEKRWWGWETIKNYESTLEGRKLMEFFIEDLRRQGVICIKMN